MRIRSGFIAIAAIIQSILFLVHFFIYKTWSFAPAGSGFSGEWLKLTIGVLSVSFLAATLLAFRYTNPAIRTLYRIAAVWLGIVSFLFFAACASWVVFWVTRIAGMNLGFHQIGEILYVSAVFGRLSPVLNPRLTPIPPITV